MSRTPQIGLEPRVCEVCGSSYQPYRSNARACSRTCYHRLPYVKAKDSAYKALPQIRLRRNVARHVDVNPLRREVNLRRTLSLYGITPDEYQAKLAAQNGKCAICGKPPTVGGLKSAFRLHVDHDHIAGVNRGLLCNRCNPGVGYFQNDIALLQAAIEYLRRYT